MRSLTCSDFSLSRKLRKLRKKKRLKNRVLASKTASNVSFKYRAKTKGNLMLGRGNEFMLGVYIDILALIKILALGFDYKFNYNFEWNIPNFSKKTIWLESPFKTKCLTKISSLFQTFCLEYNWHLRFTAQNNRTQKALSVDF